MTRGFAQGAGAGGRVRLRTLSNLRWLAVAGQSVALFLVYFALGYPLPIVYCAVAIAVSAALNIVLALRYPPTHRLTNREATYYLAFDVLQLAALLYLTGGIANPFALMFVGWQAKMNRRFGYCIPMRRRDPKHRRRHLLQHRALRHLPLQAAPAA